MQLDCILGQYNMHDNKTSKRTTAGMNMASGGRYQEAIASREYAWEGIDFN